MQEVHPSASEIVSAAAESLGILRTSQITNPETVRALGCGTAEAYVTDLHKLSFACRPTGGNRPPWSV